MSHVEYIVEVDNTRIEWFDVLWGAFTVIAIGGCAYFYYNKKFGKPKKLVL